VLQTTNLNLEHETRKNVAGLRRLIDLVPLGAVEEPLVETQAHPYVSSYVYFGKANQWIQYAYRALMQPE